MKQRPRHSPNRTAAHAARVGGGRQDKTALDGFGPAEGLKPVEPGTQVDVQGKVVLALNRLALALTNRRRASPAGLTAQVVDTAAMFFHWYHRATGPNDVVAGRGELGQKYWATSPNVGFLFSRGSALRIICGRQRMQALGLGGRSMPTGARVLTLAEVTNDGQVGLALRSTMSSGIVINSRSTLELLSQNTLPRQLGPLFIHYAQHMLENID